MEAKIVFALFVLQAPCPTPEDICRDRAQARV